MTIVKKTVDGNEYEFVNSSRGNRSGFVHEATLFRNGSYEGEAKIQYYNRTWECYTYQSVMKRLVHGLIECCEEAFQTAWKEEHNVKRLTEAKKNAMQEDLRNNPPKNYVELVELYTLL